MSGHHEGTIAALGRHSGTGLVRRYAHLHPDYLAGVLEDVASFGKRTDAPVQALSEGETTYGTGPKTGNEGQQKGTLSTEIVKRLERAMGFEPTTTSLGS